MSSSARALRDRGRAHATGWAAIVLVVAAGLAYGNSFSGPFVFDDVGSIVDNPTIRHLGAWGQILHPPAGGGLTVGGRPVLNLSLALNYAVSGTQVWSYHALNLLIHILAGLTLFGVLRRTLEKVGTGGPPVRSPSGSLALTERTAARAARPYLFAFAVALLWTVHPLQTEAVTYIIQRAESLMGLFYLLTLYCFIRGAEPRVGRVILNPPENTAERGRSERRIKDNPPYLWFGLSWLACLLGMGTKEVMVSAPVMVLLYDRAFLSGSFQAAWRTRWRYYLALASTWLLLAWLVASTGGSRGGTSGFGLKVSWGSYLLTQGPAILHYLRLVLWPHPLVFYYTARWVHGASAWAETGMVAALLAGTGYALWRLPVLGFVGAWFFAILAPTSLVPGPAETMAEHRMYLPLAAVLAVGVYGLGLLIEKMGRVKNGARQAPLFIGLALSVLCCAFTLRRNKVYQSDLALWSDTVEQSPDNPYVQNNLGVSLTRIGRLPEARDCFIRGLRLKPDFADAYVNLGNVSRDQGRTEEAAAEFTRALRFKPDDADAYNNLGNILQAEGQAREAMAEFAQALHFKPDDAEAYNGLGTALTDSGRLSEAMDAFEQALRLRPDYAQAEYNFGIALAATGRTPEAIVRYQTALRLDPDLFEARLNLGNALALTGHYAEAAAQYEAALRIRPDYAPARDNLARLRALESANLPP